MKKLFYGCILLLFYSSCFPGNKKKNACDKEALLTDTRIFSMKSDDIYIDHTYCIKFMDEVICLQGRIENKRSLQENILLLNIPHIDSLNNEMSSGLGYLNEETATWFNPVQLNKDPIISTIIKKCQSIPKNGCIIEMEGFRTLFM